MLISNLMLSIQTHAEQLTAAFVAELESDPKTAHLARIAHEDLNEGATTLYVRLSDWLGNRDIKELEGNFRARARRQRQAGIPLSEILYAVILLKKHLWEFVRRNALVDSISDLYQRDEAFVLIGQFFDRLFYATALGYEEGEERWKEPMLFA